MSFCGLCCLFGSACGTCCGDKKETNVNVPLNRSKHTPPVFRIGKKDFLGRMYDQVESIKKNINKVIDERAYKEGVKGKSYATIMMAKFSKTHKSGIIKEGMDKLRAEELEELKN